MDGAFFADSGANASSWASTDSGPLGRTASTQVHARVCGSCGFVELYANQPAELYEVYCQAEARAH